MKQILHAFTFIHCTDARLNMLANE